MSNLDFSAAVAAAQAVVDRQMSGNGGASYKYPLIYPPKGNTIVVRPLFNPKSGQVVRLINRHDTNNKDIGKVACYRTYNQECPICKMQEQIKDALGQDPFGRVSSSKSRGICFAQFVSSTIPIEKNKDHETLKQGDIILFMFPWSVYQQINTTIQAIAQTPTGMEQAFSHATTGLVIQVTVDDSFKYTTVQVPYITVDTGLTDEQFIAQLESMDDLSEQLLPKTITDDVKKQVDEYTQLLYDQYIAPKTPSYTNNSTPQTVEQAISSPTVSQTGSLPNTTPSTPATANSTTPIQESPQQNPERPACYGKHEEGKPLCICCPVELECKQNSVNTTTDYEEIIDDDDDVPF